MENQALNKERIAANQAANRGVAQAGAYITSQETTAAYYGDLAGVQGRGLGPATLRIEVPAAEFQAFAARYGINVETLIVRPPFAGATETLIPFPFLDEFNAMASFFLHR